MINKLVQNIKKTNAPIVVGLDPMLNYIPENIQKKAGFSNIDGAIEVAAFAQAEGNNNKEKVKNALFAKSDKISGEELYLKLKDRGILVRHFKKPRISEFNRITVGTDEEMKALIVAIKDILKEKCNESI